MKKVTLSDQKLNAIIRETKEKILASLPAGEQTFTGEQIMKIAQHRQVNYFLLFQISQEWNAHLPSLRHPYFDFENAEVKQAMAKFVNTVSRFISVQRKDLDTLLDRAIFNTIRLILDPAEVLVKFFFGSGEVIPLALYRKHAPYFSDFDFVIQSISAYHEKNNLQEVRKEVFLEKFGKVLEIFEKKEGKSLQLFQRHYFQSLTGLILDDVIAKDSYDQKAEAPKAEIKPVTPPTTRVVPPVTPPPVAKPVEQKPPVTPPVVPPPVVQKPVTPPPAKEEVKTPPLVGKEPVNPPASEQKSLAEKFAQEKTSISDLYAKKSEEKKASLNELYNNPLDKRNQVEADEKPVIQLRQEETKTPPVEQKPVLPETPVVIPPVVSEPVVVTPPVGEVKPIVPPAVPDPPVLMEAPVTETPVYTPPPVVETPPVAQVVVPPPVVETPQPEVKAEPPVIETPIDLFAPREEQAETPTALHEKLQDEQRTSLADKFRSQQEQQRPLHEKTENKSIRIDQIPVHKQFQFVQKVFGGSSVRFKVMLDKINETHNSAELEDLLNKYVFSEEGVNRDDKVTQEFLILVRNRFGN